jgi:multiple sugar transport system permease protein
MAFPAEVTMIPAFLLLKNFPLLHLLLAVLAATLATAVAIRIHPTLSDRAKIIIPLATFVAMMLLPSLFGRTIPTVSLLNTFWALVLPSMANGFSIFLLKGFFDSLPQELYEAAAIDGATEWHKFWLITMSLSKPILAVLALGAFTAAYSEFMMALVIIPDQRMWTLMVWLFQLQTASHPSVVYAGLVIAAIPTLLIFLFCQNLIMRGLVVPVEK